MLVINKIMKTLADHAIEHSTFGIPVTFHDANESLVTPIDAVWTLRDLNGNILNNRDSVVFNPLNSQMNIVLSGDDLVCDRGRETTRIIYVHSHVNSTLGNNLHICGSIRFIIDPN